MHSVFGNEKRSSHMPIQISTVAVAHNALWIGTENGVLLTFPFNAPTLVAKESGWEVIKVRRAFFFFGLLGMIQLTRGNPNSTQTNMKGFPRTDSEKH